MIAYIYQDTRRGIIRVFDSMGKAKAFAKEQIGHEPEWDGWGGHLYEQGSGYVSIHTCEIE